MNKQKSFTLIELLVVIVIIGILAGVIMISTSSSISKANITKGKVFENSVQNNLAANMVSRWKMDEGLGTMAHDSWGGNQGSLGLSPSIPTWKSGNDCVSDKCLSFDGVDDHIEMADSQELRMTTGGTITAWIYPKTGGEGGTGRIIDKSTATTGANGYVIALASSNRINLNINAGTNTTTSDNAIIYNQWNFIAITFDSTGRHIYVNAVDVTASGGGETALPPDVAGAVRIGNRAGATDRSFDGYIDDVRIYNNVFSSFQIKQNYIAGLNSLLSNNIISREEYNQRILNLSFNE